MSGPGGSSAPVVTDQHLDVPLDFESTAADGSILGTRALQMMAGDEGGRASVQENCNRRGLG